MDKISNRHCIKDGVEKTSTHRVCWRQADGSRPMVPPTGEQSQWQVKAGQKRKLEMRKRKKCT